MTVRLTETVLQRLARTMPDVRHCEKVGDRRYRGQQALGAVDGWRFVGISADGEHEAHTFVADGGLRPDQQALAHEDAWRLIERELAHAALPTCVVADCAEKAPVVFTAAAPGRLAGRDWQPGDQIRLRPAHGHDVHEAQGVDDADRLAPWLRADARLARRAPIPRVRASR